MGFYEELEVTRVINAAGTLTRLGGNRMAPEVLAAMAEANASNVHMDDLQAAAGEIVAAVTGAEAGLVTAGASAGLTLATAACMVGTDPAAMDQLPDTTELRNEVVVQRGHRNAYDHAIRASGARFVEAGYLGYPGAGGTLPWQVEAAITDRTCAVACPILDNSPGTLDLPAIAEIAHRHNLPVIVDASSTLPPRANLKRFIAEGADLVVYSGGKGIGGPQASGLLAGRAEWIASAALQHLDMDVRAETWPQRTPFAASITQGIPHQGLGRSLKVGREQIAGLITALRRFVAGDDAADQQRWLEMLRRIAEGLPDRPGLDHAIVSSTVPLLEIRIDPVALGFSAYEAVSRLNAGDPAIAVGETRAELGIVALNPMVLTNNEADTVRAALSALFAA